jgi:hypothetical protein
MLNRVSVSPRAVISIGTSFGRVLLQRNKLVEAQLASRRVRQARERTRWEICMAAQGQLGEAEELRLKKQVLLHSRMGLACRRGTAWVGRAFTVVLAGSTCGYQ